MESANDILDELTSWGSLLANMPRHMPYIIPDQYFENFAGTLQHLISEEDSIHEQLKGIDTPYIIPQGYFEQFPGQVLAEIADDEMMQQGSKAMPFEIPGGYFDALPAQLLAAAKAGSNNNKIIPVKRRTIEWKVRWAAAAVLLICISIGSYKSVMRQQPYNTERALSAVPNSEINAYVQQNIDDFDVDMIVSNMAVNGISIQSKQLDNKEIIEYLNENGWQDVE